MLKVDPKVQKRNSSIELFRIIAMLFVVVVHCNGWLVGGIPDDFDEHNISLFRVSQATIQAFTCTCVNMFLLISGYFGLKLKWKSILNIYMLLISVTIPFYLVSCIIKMNDFSLISLLGKFLAISKSGYFVECYLLLMFFSPVFNAFVEKEGKRMLLWALAFWIVEIYFDFLKQDADLGFAEGYSFIHFVLIYMLGRTMSLYKEKFLRIQSFKYVILYLFSSLVILMGYVFLDMPSSYNYTSPFNIIASCSLFIIFARMTFYSKWINWIASSTFAVYIIHTHPPVFNWLKTIDNYMLLGYSYPKYLAMMGGVVFVVFVGSILYDKIMKIFTVSIVSKVEQVTNNVKSRLSKT